MCEGDFNMTQTDNQVRQGKRQHPLWIVFSVGKSIKEVIIPIIYFFLINMNSDSSFVKYGSLALIAYMIYRLITILFSWKNYKYVITDKNIELTEGRLKTEKRYISLDRIQSIQQNTSFFHRLVGLTSLTLLTGTTDNNASVKMDAITVVEAENIRGQLNPSQDIEKAEMESQTKTKLNLVEDMLQIDEPTKHYEMTRKEIVKASLTSFYFLAPLPFLLAIYSKVEDFFSIDDFADDVLHTLNLTWITITIIVIMAILLSVIIGVAITYLQYGNFQTSSNQERVFIRKGVLSETNFSIPKNRINAIKFNKSLIRRWVKMVKVELVSAGSFDDSAAQTNVLLPFISEKRAMQLIPEILPDFQIHTDMTKLTRAAFWTNLLKPSYLWIAATAAVLYFWPAFWYLSLVLLMLIIILRITDFHHSGYALHGAYIQLQSGTFSTELFLTTKKKVAEMKITESWLQRRLGLATLSISTRAKPIQVTSITDIPKAAAMKYYHWYATRKQ